MPNDGAFLHVIHRCSSFLTARILAQKQLRELDDLSDFISKYLSRTVTEVSNVHELLIPKESYYVPLNMLANVFKDTEEANYGTNDPNTHHPLLCVDVSHDAEDGEQGQVSRNSTPIDISALFEMSPTMPNFVTQTGRRRDGSEEYLCAEVKRRILDTNAPGVGFGLFRPLCAHFVAPLTLENVLLCSMEYFVVVYDVTFGITVPPQVRRHP